MTLDIRTLVLVSLFVTLIMTVAMIVIWRAREEASLKHWMAAGAAVSLGLFLQLLRGQIHDALSIPLANALIALASGLTWTGIDSFLGKKPRWTIIAIVVGGIFCTFWYLTFIAPDINARVAIISAVTGGFSLIAAWRLAIDPGARDLTPARNFLVFVLLSHTAFTAFRIVFTLAADPIADFLTAGPVQASAAFDLIFTAVGQIMGFYALVDQRHMQQLARARAEAERANVAKSEFLASMSHELRTPLNAIIGFSEIMAKEVMGTMPEKYREYSEDIRLSGTQLLALINDLLDLARIEAGRLELRETEFDLGGIVRRARAATWALASRNNVKVDIPEDRELPYIYADQLRVEQVVTSLVTNAVRFSPRGHVRVTVGNDDTDILLRIVDDGPGMSQDEIEIALAPTKPTEYAQLTKTLKATGLGLPLSAALIRLHGGRVEITSEAGVGTTATIRLPRTRLREFPA